MCSHRAHGKAVAEIRSGERARGERGEGLAAVGELTVNETVVEALQPADEATASALGDMIGPYKQLMSQARTEPGVAIDTRICPECLSAIPADASAGATSMQPSVCSPASRERSMV